MSNTVPSRGDTNTPTIIIQQPGRRLLMMVILFLLGISVMLNLGFLISLADYVGETDGPNETFRSGTRTSSNKIARIAVDFTIMPPYSGRLLKTIEHVRKDDDVRGVVLVIDSPGGLVSDSHQIYHHLKLLAEEKPVFVQMKGIAASGGYYIAMGGGPDAPVYAEPTTWTGSIGVIIPRYNAANLADKIGVQPDSLKTGPLKDTLNPLRDLTEREREVWDVILAQSLDRFVGVIDENRPNLTEEKIRELATGQVYTAEQAVENGLVDKIVFEEETVEELVAKLELSDHRYVEYAFPISLAETLLGAKGPEVHLDPLSRILDASTPRAMYLFGWYNGPQTGKF